MKRNGTRLVFGGNTIIYACSTGLNCLELMKGNKNTYKEVSSTLASYTHMKIALCGKVITNILFFSPDQVRKHIFLKSNSCQMV